MATGTSNPRSAPVDTDANAPSTTSPKVGRPPDRWRYLWLGAGAVLSLFAVNGRWDIPLAAWLFSILLLRFSRTSRPAVGIGLVWLACVGASMFFLWHVAVPLTGMTTLGGLAFGTVLALPYLADRLLAPRLGTAASLLLFPMALAACEFLLGVFGPFGTAYGLLADTQYANPALSQSISLAGPYVIGFLIGSLATVMNYLWEHPLSWRTARVPIAYAAVLGAVIVSGSARLAFFPTPTTQTVRIAGINPSRAALDAQMRALGRPRFDPMAVPRFDPATVPVESAAVIDGLFDDTRRAARSGAKIIVWSENAARISASEEPAFLAAAQNVARQEQVYLDVATNVYLPNPPYGRDETHLIAPDGTQLWTYQKSHPIPGLETYTPGNGQVPVVNTPYGRIANVICYDADFPAMMHTDADIMLIPGGDWPQFGRLHTQMSSLRAIENGYSLLRQDFNGWSAAYDYHGQPISTQDTTVDHGPWIVDVPTHGTTTLYRLTGDIFAWLCLAGTLALTAIGIIPRRRRPIIGARTPRTVPVPMAR
ncbi:nitrilase-related carbon-nitrogen hydrolase [Nocardia sp. NPDC088792]|uniref:nitrilase-related carbon-nitrogen hydrolase n=1 Tax=Nocardia sp. NPDC088792 TaxID=3364332 RepID=UPI003800D39E